MKCFKHPSKDATGTCSSCGKGICADCAVEVDDKLLCKECVAKGKSKKSTTAGGKSPVLAALLSFLFSGLGQIYNGELTKGLILAVVYLISWLLSWFLIGCCTTPIIWLYGIYDAYHSADQINKGEK